MPELTAYNLNVHSRVDFNIGNPKPESTLALCQSRLYTLVRNFGFGLRGPTNLVINVHKAINLGLWKIQDLELELDS